MEHTNQVLEQVLRNYTIYEQDNWDELLPFTEFAYNNFVNFGTGFSSFYILFRQEVNTWSTIVYTANNTKATTKIEILLTPLTPSGRTSLLHKKHRQLITINDIETFGDKVVLSTKNLK